MKHLLFLLMISSSAASLNAIGLPYWKNAVNYLPSISSLTDIDYKAQAQKVWNFAKENQKVTLFSAATLGYLTWTDKKRVRNYFLIGTGLYIGWKYLVNFLDILQKLKDLEAKLIGLEKISGDIKSDTGNIQLAMNDSKVDIQNLKLSVDGNATDIKNQISELLSKIAKLEDNLAKGQGGHKELLQQLYDMQKQILSILTTNHK